MSKPRDELREKLSKLPIKVIVKSTNLGRYLADETIDQILSQVDTYVKGIIGEDVEKTSQVEGSSVAKYYVNKSKADQRNRAGLEEERQ